MSWNLVFIFSFLSINYASNTHIYRIGIGGSLETYGSLLAMPNQTLHIENKAHVVIDTPTYIQCKGFTYGNTVSLFCPDVYLYFRWKELLKKMIKKHSNLVIKNIPSRPHLDVSEINVLSFECPEDGTILTYGDARCRFETLHHESRDERTIGKCERLVPMILQSTTNIISRKIHLWMGGNEWKNLFLPCTIPFYICAYGPPPNHVTIDETKVPSVEGHAYHGYRGIDKYHIIVRDAKFDCLMSEHFTDLFSEIKDCVFNQPSYNTTAFTLQLEMLKNNVIPNACYEDGICSTAFQLATDKIDDQKNFCPKHFKQEIIEIDKRYYHPSLTDNSGMPSVEINTKTFPSKKPQPAVNVTTRIRPMHLQENDEKKDNSVLNLPVKGTKYVEEYDESEYTHEIEEMYLFKYTNTRIDNLHNDNKYLLPILILMHIILIIFTLLLCTYIFCNRTAILMRYTTGSKFVV